jgi:hypothetical protein
MQEAETVRATLVDLRRRIGVASAQRRESRSRFRQAVADAVLFGVDRQRIAAATGLLPAAVRRMGPPYVAGRHFPPRTEEEHLQVIADTQEDAHRIAANCTALEIQLRSAMIEALQTQQLNLHQICSLTNVSGARVRSAVQWHAHDG